MQGKRGRPWQEQGVCKRYSACGFTSTVYCMIRLFCDLFARTTEQSMSLAIQHQTFRLSSSTVG